MQMSKDLLIYVLPHAVNCGRFSFWRRQSVVFCLCMKYLGNRRTNLRQIHKEDVFRQSLRRVRRSRSKVEGQGHQGQRNGIFAALSTACVRFMFGKTSLASSLVAYLFTYLFTHSLTHSLTYLHISPVFQHLPEPNKACLGGVW